MAGSMVYRLRVDAPGAAHMAKLREAIGALQGIRDNRGYNYIAGFHGAPGNYCWHHQQSRRTPLQARLFLPWHRAYLWWLEEAMQDQVDGAALAWWDWTAGTGLPQAYTVAQVGGTANPLTGSRMSVPSAGLNRRTRRAAGRTPGVRLPTSAEVNSLLNDTDWASFSDRIESIHDQVHVWVGSDMSDITTAAFVDSALNAAGFVGFAFPQGVGVFEGSSVYLLGCLGVSAPAALAFALARRGRMLLVSLSGVVVHLIRKARHPTVTEAA